MKENGVEVKEDGVYVLVVGGCEGEDVMIEGGGGVGGYVECGGMVGEVMENVLRG